MATVVAAPLLVEEVPEAALAVVEEAELEQAEAPPVDDPAVEEEEEGLVTEEVHPVVVPTVLVPLVELAEVVAVVGEEELTGALPGAGDMEVLAEVEAATGVLSGPLFALGMSERKRKEASTVAAPVAKERRKKAKASRHSPGPVGVQLGGTGVSGVGGVPLHIEDVVVSLALASEREFVCAVHQAVRQMMGSYGPGGMARWRSWLEGYIEKVCQGTGGVRASLGQALAGRAVFLPPGWVGLRGCGYTDEYTGMFDGYKVDKEAAVERQVRDWGEEAENMDTGAIGAEGRWWSVFFPRG